MTKINDLGSNKKDVLNDPPFVVLKIGASDSFLMALRFESDNNLADFKCMHSLCLPFQTGVSKPWPDPPATSLVNKV